jgi:hypothetical protein
MSDDTPSPLNNVITIDDERIKSHLDRVVRGTVEEALNALLDTEADRLFIPDPIANTNRIRINTLALGARLPTLHGLREYVEAGPDILWTKRPKPVPSCRQLGRQNSARVESGRHAHRTTDQVRSRHQLDHCQDTRQGFLQ